MINRSKGHDPFPVARSACLAVAALATVAVAVRAQAQTLEPDTLGYVTTITPEPRESRDARHRKVAERRAGTPILVHRGAHAIAPENTIEAYAAAMDLGADGVEIDIRRSADGVLYLLHDDTLDRVSDGQGKVKGLTYHDLLKHRFEPVYGPATRQTRIPTLASCLLLARQRAALLHLDVKEPGLQDDIERMLDQADVWDHIVYVNAGNAERLRAHSKVRLLHYKGSFPQGKHARDPDAIRDFLGKPGNMIFCEDPRDAARALNRQPVPPVPLPEGLRVPWSPKALQ
jgi:hypothetical protein